MSLFKVFKKFFFCITVLLVTTGTLSAQVTPWSAEYGKIRLGPGVSSVQLADYFDDTSILYYPEDTWYPVYMFTDYDPATGGIRSLAKKELFRPISTAVNSLGRYDGWAFTTIAIGPFGDEDGEMTMFGWGWGDMSERFQAQSRGISFIRVDDLRSQNIAAGGEVVTKFLRADLQKRGKPFNFPSGGASGYDSRTGALPRINGFSGGEVNQITGEIYLAGEEDRTFWHTNCDRYPYKNPNPTTPCADRIYDFMILNPLTGEWRSSGIVKPLDPVVDGKLGGKLISSDMAIDADGVLYVMVAGDDNRDYYLVRIVPSTEGNWKYNILHRLQRLPWGSYDIWGMGFLNSKIYYTGNNRVAVIDPVTGSVKEIGSGSLGRDTVAFDMATAGVAPIVRGKVYYDKVGNENIDFTKDEGVVNVEIQLLDKDKKVLQTQYTISNGDYSFFLPFRYKNGTTEKYYIRMKQPQISGGNSHQIWASGGRFEWAGKKHKGNNTATAICHNGNVQIKLNPSALEYGGSCYGARADGIDGNSFNDSNYYFEIEMQTERAVVYANFGLAAIDRGDAPHNIAVGGTTYKLGEVSHTMLSNKVKLGSAISSDLAGSLSSADASKDTVGDESFTYRLDDNVTWKSVQGQSFDNNVTYKFRISIANNTLPATSNLTLGVWTNWDPKALDISGTTFSKLINYSVIPADTSVYEFDYKFGGSSKTDKTYNIFFRTKLSTSDIVSNANPVRLSSEADTLPWVLDGEVEDYWQKVNYIANVTAPVSKIIVANQNFALNNGDTVDFETHSLIALYTQVANKDFTSVVVFLDDANKTVKLDQNLSFVIDLVSLNITNPTEAECKAATTLMSNFFSGNSSGHLHTLKNKKISVASESATFRVKYNDNSVDKYSCASDSFSIRPQTYKTTIAGNLIGGKNENITINAVDALDSTTTSYNQTGSNIAIKANSIVLNKPTGCTAPDATDSDFTIAISDNFTSGKVNGTVKYNNIGNINATVVDEKWATVDIDSSDCTKDSSNNTHDSSGKLGCNIEHNITLMFNPKEFQNTVEVKNFNNSTFTYLSSNKSMGASVYMNVTAVLFDNKIAINYQKDCWAYDTNITVNLLSGASLDGWGTNRYDSAHNRIKFDPTKTEVNKDKFMNGTVANVKIDFNFGRNITKSENPFFAKNTDFNVTEIKDTNNITGNSSTTTNNATASNATFFYGKAHSIDYVGQSPINAIMRYEVYCGVGCSTSTYGITSSGSNPSYAYWYINNMHNSSIFGNMTSIKEQKASGGISINPSTSVSMVNGKEDIVLTHGNPPHADDVRIFTQDWLVHDKYNGFATYNKFNVEFIGAGGGWAGHGVINNETSVSDRDIGRVINTNTSNRTKQKLDW